MENNPLSLYEFLGEVKTSLKNNLPYSTWVTAEISELKVNYSGHCYLELIEKEPAGESVKARARATIWSSVYRLIQPYFETTTHSRLATGMKVMVKAAVEFHELYGFSLNITDIEPAYTIGEMALQRQEIINRLMAEGVFDMNKSLTVADLPGRIAVISSKTAAGLGDFMDQLTKNDFGYKFYVKLFPAVMQGVEAEQSIIAALDRIFTHEDFFDLVVIIRGGGSQSDLNCFNSYWLAYHICQFPIPVFTGIGHEQDETIADLVAHTRLKTPTAVAEFLIGIYRVADEKINELSISLTDAATDLVEIERDRFSTFLKSLKPEVIKYLTASSGNLRFHGIRLSGFAKQRLILESGIGNRRSDLLRERCRKYLDQNKHILDMLDKKCTYMDPFLILKRGYSVTYFQGKAIKDPEKVPLQSELITRLAGGMMKSKKSE
jgi:exodeoxyribonuclease VII large subunit